MSAGIFICWLDGRIIALSSLEGSKNAYPIPLRFVLQWWAPIVWVSKPVFASPLIHLFKWALCFLFGAVFIVTCLSGIVIQ